MGAAGAAGMLAALLAVSVAPPPGPGPADADPHTLPDAVLDAMRGSVCGEGDYPDPRDPSSISGFGAPKRVVGGAGGDQS